MEIGVLTDRRYLRDRHLRAELDGLGKRQLGKPLSVAEELEPVRVAVENAKHLLEVGPGICIDLLAAERRPGLVAAGRVATAPCSRR